jgi:O-antigen ligase
MTDAAVGADGRDSRTPLLTALIVAMFVCMAPVGYLWAIGFAALGALAGLACAPVLVRARQPLWLVLPALAMVAWAAASLLWSRAGVDPHALTRYADVEKLTGLKLLFQLALYGALIAATRQISPRGATLALTVLAAALGVLGLAILLDASRGAAIYLQLTTLLGQHIHPDIARRNITQGEYAIVLFVWCVSVRLFEMKLQALILLLFGCVIVASLMLREADAPLAALALGLVAFLVVWNFRTWGVGVLAAATLLYWLAAPFAVMAAVHQGLWIKLHQHVRESWSQRLDIWGFSAARIGEKPLAGWGLDASRTFGTAILLHTHNAALQIWLELGLVGAVLVTVFWLGLWTIIEGWARRDRPLAAAAAATAVSYLTIGALSFGVWQEWWLALGAMAAAALVCLKRSRSWWNAEPGSEKELVPL